MHDSDNKTRQSNDDSKTKENKENDQNKNKEEIAIGKDTKNGFASLHYIDWHLRFGNIDDLNMLFYFIKNYINYFGCQDNPPFWKIRISMEWPQNESRSKNGNKQTDKIQKALLIIDNFRQKQQLIQWNEDIKVLFKMINDLFIRKGIPVKFSISFDYCYWARLPSGTRMVDVDQNEYLKEIETFYHQFFKKSFQCEFEGYSALIIDDKCGHNPNRFCMYQYKKPKCNIMCFALDQPKIEATMEQRELGVSGGKVVSFSFNVENAKLNPQSIN